jgi:hypothetical protein
VDSLDSLNIFMEYLKELEKKETEMLNLKRMENKRKSRLARDKFRVCRSRDFPKNSYSTSHPG